MRAVWVVVGLLAGLVRSEELLSLPRTTTQPVSAVEVHTTGGTTTSVVAQQQQRTPQQVLLDHVHRMVPHTIARHRAVQEAVIDDSTAATAAASLDAICHTVQESFTDHKVECTCLGSPHMGSGGTFIMNCAYTDEICHATSTSLTCGKPQIGVSLVDGMLFSSTTCMQDYRRGMLPLQDTCVFVDVCNDDDNNNDGTTTTTTDGGLCGCTASYGGEICGKCEICPGGHAISVDCTNSNLEAITKECQAVDLDLAWDEQESTLSGFAPNFSGFCSDLESSLDNRIACDCSEAVGGSFSLTCATLSPVCAHSGCGKVESTLAIENGKQEALTTCMHHETAPFAGATSCTGLHLDTAAAAQAGTLASCWATFNGTNCNSCDVCSSGSAITMDCSNAHEMAIVSECQAVNLTSSTYEFVPRFLYQQYEEEPKDPEVAKQPITTAAAASGASTLWTARVTVALVALCFFRLG